MRARTQGRLGRPPSKQAAAWVPLRDKFWFAWRPQGPGRWGLGEGRSPVAGFDPSEALCDPNPCSPQRLREMEDEEDQTKSGGCGSPFGLAPSHQRP